MHASNEERFRLQHVESLWPKNAQAPDTRIGTDAGLVKDVNIVTDQTTNATLGFVLRSDTGKLYYQPNVGNQPALVYTERNSGQQTTQFSVGAQGTGTAGGQVSAKIPLPEGPEITPQGNGSLSAQLSTNGSNAVMTGSERSLQVTPIVTTQIREIKSAADLPSGVNVDVLKDPKQLYADTGSRQLVPPTPTNTIDAFDKTHAPPQRDLPENPIVEKWHQTVKGFEGMMTTIVRPFQGQPVVSVPTPEQVLSQSRH